MSRDELERRLSESLQIPAVEPSRLAAAMERARETLTGIEQRSPLPGQSTLRLVFAAMILSVSMTLLMVVGPLGWHLMTPFQKTACVVLLGAVAILEADQLARVMVPGSKRLMRSSLVILLGFVLTSAIALLFPYEPHTVDPAWNWNCFQSALTLAIPTAVLAMLVVRRGMSLSLSETGAMVGMFAAAGGTIVMQLHCDINESSHVMIGHVLPLVVGAGLGWVFGWAVAKAGGSTS